MEEVTVKMMKGAPGMELVPISDTRLSSLGQIQIMKRNITAQGALPWAAVAVAVLPTFLLVTHIFLNQSPPFWSAVAMMSRLAAVLQCPPCTLSHILRHGNDPLSTCESIPP